MLGYRMRLGDLVANGHLAVRTMSGLAAPDADLVCASADLDDLDADVDVLSADVGDASAELGCGCGAAFVSRLSTRGPPAPA
ncbi:hypothetical protein BAY61_29900 [Prauserella marina]|uniref:Uncharacterized protein n=1 Tax=Prauserella marina TaxID=530584 RepID=A0A222VX17_9PSEU|nr:hypothetical protein [Prauserella marina]ASR38516.1 hypothetical protein BAY61_29900 [Prauserella marina]PWV81817.1 hypothetical protein DES30_10247 [Prauserella marina]SDD12982.1 hypothetical protein SAMN05421630_10647 [Prauserella marina]